MSSESQTVNNYFFPCFILNSIVFFNTDLDAFIKVMPYGENYYKFYQVTTWSSLCIIINTLLYLLLICLCHKKSRFSLLFSNFYDFSIIIIGILQVCVMANVWHYSPYHTVLFYPEYWTKGCVVFPSNYTGVKWPYLMSDIVFRIESFLTIMTILLTVITLCCMGCFGLSCRGRNDSIVTL